VHAFQLQALGIGRGSDFPRYYVSLHGAVMLDLGPETLEPRDGTARPCSGNDANPAQVRFNYDHVVQALPADRSNEPFNVSVLPG
jgi:hypothetical protein